MITGPNCVGARRGPVSAQGVAHKVSGTPIDRTRAPGPPFDISLSVLRGFSGVICRKPRSAGNIRGMAFLMTITPQQSPVKAVQVPAGQSPRMLLQQCRDPDGYIGYCIGDYTP